MLRRLTVLAGVALLTGCATFHPAELQLPKDRDGDQCRVADGERAIAACRRALDRPPLSERTTVETRGVVYALRSYHAILLGWRLMRAGRPGEALAVADTALDIAERFKRAGPLRAPSAEAERLRAYTLQRAGGHAVAAGALVRLRRWDDATPHLRELVGGVPDKAVFWGTLGVVANQAGYFEESSAAFARAEELDPRYFAGERRGQREIWHASQEGRRFDTATFEEELLL